MAIYLDISAAVHARAGLGRYASSLAQALVTKSPDQLALFFNSGNHSLPLPTELAGIPTCSVAVGYKPWRMAVWLGQMFGLGFDRLLPGADLYHATEHLLMPLRRVPSVLTVHDLIFNLFPQHHKRLNYWYLNAAMPLFCRRARAIIAVSQATKRDLVRVYGLEESKITVIHEAAAPHFTVSSPNKIEQTRAKYGLPDRYLLHVGTIEPRKNLGTLLEAIHSLRAAGEDISLVVVGSKGWLYQGFFQRLEALSLQDAVLFPGYIPDADLPAVYGAATTLVESSLYEGFGLPLLEAMACGAPVLCSNSSSLPEVGGDAARYFDPTQPDDMAQAILQFWRDDELQQTMRMAGLARAATFSWDRVAEETLAVYAKTMAP